jgi:amidohydrolase
LTGEKVFPAVDSIKEKIIAINDYILANPEIGHQEVKSAQYLVEQLQAAGFAVEVGAGGFPTAFKAVYQGKTPGPTVAFLAEYDALPGIGHACGHNLIAAAACGAGMALQKMMGDLPGTIVVMGTPAEEVPPPVKGKMIENGAFDGVDVSLTIHGADRTAAGGQALAVDILDITYTGQTSHAAASPDRGRSALDGALLAMHAIEMLREHVRSDTRIHGIITNGGEAPNIVPGKATLRYMVRALDRSYVDAVVQRLEKCFQAGALATETTVSITNLGKWDNKINLDS